MAANPFFWGPGGQAITPDQLARNRRVAEALRQNEKPTGVWSLVGNLAQEAVGNWRDAEADRQEGEQNKRVKEALAAAQTPEDYLRVAGDEWSPPGTTAIASALATRMFGQQDRQDDRAYQAGIRADDRSYQEQLADQERAWRLEDRGAEWGREDQQLADQREYDEPLRTVQLEGAQLDLDRTRNPPQFVDVSPEEAASLGLPEGSVAQRAPNNQLSTIGGGSGGITIQTGDNSNKFNNRADELAAARMDGYVADGNNASVMMGDLQALSSIGKNLNTGMGQQITQQLGPLAEMVGIDIAGLSEGQAYEAIVSRMAPQMRTPGAGASSDFDARQFLLSLPSLGNTPEGNALISETLMAIQEHKMAAAQLASEALSGQSSWQDADEDIRALGDPYTRFKAYQEALSGENGLPQTPRRTQIIGGRQFEEVEPGVWDEVN